MQKALVNTGIACRVYIGCYRKRVLVFLVVIENIGDPKSNDCERIILFHYMENVTPQSVRKETSQTSQI